MRDSTVGLGYKKSEALVWTPALVLLLKWSLNKRNTWLYSKSLIEYTPIDEVPSETPETVSNNMHWPEEIFVNSVKNTDLSFLPPAH